MGRKSRWLVLVASILAAVLCRNWVCLWKLVAGDQKLLGLQPEADQPAWSGKGYR